jgi:diguanylate cyclase (GGDEF)-like protein
MHRMRARQNSGRASDELRFPRQVSLPGMLIIPFILQVVTVVGLVGYLSYRNGQRSVEDLTNQLMNAVSKRVEQKLTSYLETAQYMNQINSDAVRRGDLSMDLSISDPQRERFLWQQMQLFNNLTWNTLGSEAGDSVGVWRPGAGEDLQMSLSNRSTEYFGTYYAMNQQGKRTVKLKVERPVFDPRTRPWYREAIAAKTALWTSIYSGFTPGTVFIAASQPLYAPTGKLVGVSGTDISLLAIRDFLAQTPVSSTGQIFLIERTGLLVASSSQEPPFRLVQGQPPVRVNALESQTPLIRATAQFLQQQFEAFKVIQQQQSFHVRLNGKGEFIQVLPFTMERGLDWLIVIVVPEADVMAQIHAGTQTTFWLCLAALAAVIGLNTLISRWLVKPIVGLSQASQQIAQGDFSRQVQSPGIRELSTLAASFTQMSQEIQQSRQQLEDYSRSLEQKVSQRTQALQQEVQQRLAAETALQAANQELQRLAYLDGLTQIPNRRQFDERLDQEWRKMQRDQMPLALILCDVDYFKQYNDAYGHQAGDDCLRHVAKAITTVARRPADLAARYGGEEFVVLLPNTPLTGAVAVAKVMQAEIKALQLPHQDSEVAPDVTMSFGVSCLIPSDCQGPEQLLQQVDQALYQAKTAGRNQIAVS